MILTNRRKNWYSNQEFQMLFLDVNRAIFNKGVFHD